MTKTREMLKKKLRSRAGESLSETLVALLISAVALVMLACAITTANGVIAESQKKLDKYYSAAENVVNRTTGVSGTSPASGKIEITYGEKKKEVGITYYSNSEFTKTPVVGYQISN